jgi:hypothetical protein
MKSTIKASFLTSAILALTSVGAYAANSSTATIGLTATVSSFDNITCTQSTLDLNGGTSITASGLTTGQAVTCSVTSNDTSAIDVTAYVPNTSPLTGTTSSSNTIPNTDIEWSATSGGTYTPFAALTGTGLTADDGAIVASSITIGNNTAVNFYLALNVPAAQPADTYNAVLTVAITPHA